jgi:hypothetical protein
MYLSESIEWLGMATKRLSIVAALQRAIRESGLTHYRLAKDAGISPEIIDRFMAEDKPGVKPDDKRHRDVRLETAEKLAKVLNLELRKRG